MVCFAFQNIDIWNSKFGESLQNKQKHLLRVVKYLSFYLFGAQYGGNHLAVVPCQGGLICLSQPRKNTEKNAVERTDSDL